MARFVVFFRVGGIPVVCGTSETEQQASDLAKWFSDGTLPPVHVWGAWLFQKRYPREWRRWLSAEPCEVL